MTCEQAETLLRGGLFLLRKVVRVKRRLWVWVVYAALLLRVVAPVAAYASAGPMLPFGELCSAARNAPLPVGAPDSPPIQHLLSHCGDCPCGSAAGAPLPSAMALPQFIATGVVAITVAARPAAVAAPELFPPPRGPPHSRPASA
jgi:hypothetical protein